MPPVRIASLGIAAVILTMGCGSIPSGPSMTLSLGRGPYEAVVGSSIGLLVDSPAPISNVRCSSSKGDRVEVWYGFIDWDLDGWHATVYPKTVGERIVSCTADPNASGSVVVSAIETTNVKLVYVRNGVPGPSQVNPVTAGGLEIHGKFRLSDGASAMPMYCGDFLLAWDPATLTLTCSPLFGRGVPVNFLNAACVVDPAHTMPGFSGGSIYVNDTLLTARWQGSTPSHLCMLFTIDSQGVVGPPK